MHIVKAIIKAVNSGMISNKLISFVNIPHNDQQTIPHQHPIKLPETNMCKLPKRTT